jgi:phosphate transport system ATP-binding protein
MVKFVAKDLNIWFGQVHALKNVDIEIKANEIMSIIGPSNSGKTSFLRMLNRLNDLSSGFKMDGWLGFDGEDIKRIDICGLRKRVGMVFALPLPLPLSIFENVAYGVKMHGEKRRQKVCALVEHSLKQAYLWDEVKDRLDVSAFKLSGGQQQRLCIARTLAVEPEVILFDEPCSGLDPISTSKVEEAMLKLKKDYTIVLVTNNVKQAARVGDRTAFFLSGELVELDSTEKIFTNPGDRRTDGYIRGEFG